MSFTEINCFISSDRSFSQTTFRHLLNMSRLWFHSGKYELYVHRSGGETQNVHIDLTQARNYNIYWYELSGWVVVPSNVFGIVEFVIIPHH